MKQTTINNIEELLSFTRSIPGDSFGCYRGQSDASWDLIPSFYRGLDEFKPLPSDFDDGEWLGELERDVYRDFEIKGRRFAPDRWEFHDPWHRMILAQHYGLPTRLLDWTKSPVVGAYFAVTANVDRDGVLWYLDVSAMQFPTELGRRMPDAGFRLTQIENCISRDQLSFHWPVSHNVVSSIPATAKPLKSQAIPSDQSGDSELDGFLVVIEPPVLEGRLHSQKSLFTVYISYDQQQLVWNHLSYIEQMEQYHSKSLLTKLVIPCDVKNRLKRELETNMINVDDIYPDLPGLVERLKRKRNDAFGFWKEDRKKWLTA